MTEKLTLNSLITELSNLNSSYGNLIIDAIPLEKIIKKKLLILDENKEIIKNSTKSIELENILKKFPSQAIGSVNLYNQFNHKANQFLNEINLNDLVNVTAACYHFDLVHIYVNF